MGMAFLRQRRFRYLGGMFLAAMFFATQSFNCCNLNGKLLTELFSAFAPVKTEAHACCAKPAPQERHDGTTAKGCCIHEAQLKTPQAGLEPLETPALTGPVLMVLVAPVAAPARSFAPHGPSADSGPPVFLVQRRIQV